MSTEGHSGDQISGTISGDVSGQVAVGKDIAQTQSVGAAPSQVTEAELAELRGAFADLRAQVLAAAPPESQGAALERLDELEEAVIAEEPDVSTMEYAKRWFSKHLPTIAGSVTSVVVHPIVGKLVQAAGDAVAGEFRRRFGGDARAG